MKTTETQLKSLSRAEKVKTYQAAYRLANPEKIKACQVAYYAANREKVSARSAAYQLANPDKVKAYYKANKKKITEQRRIYKGMPLPTRPCPETCECCGNMPGKKSLSLDHCHDTGAFRGWLCGSCNMATGKLGDNIEGLMKAVSYLQRASGNIAQNKFYS